MTTQCDYVYAITDYVFVYCLYVRTYVCLYQCIFWSTFKHGESCHLHTYVEVVPTVHTVHTVLILSIFCFTCESPMRGCASTRVEQ